MRRVEGAMSRNVSDKPRRWPQYIARSIPKLGNLVTQRAYVFILLAAVTLNLGILQLLPDGSLHERQNDITFQSMPHHAAMHVHVLFHLTAVVLNLGNLQVLLWRSAWRTKGAVAAPTTLP